MHNHWRAGSGTHRSSRISKGLFASAIFREGASCFTNRLFQGVLSRLATPAWIRRGWFKVTGYFFFRKVIKTPATSTTPMAGRMMTHGIDPLLEPG